MVDLEKRARDMLAEETRKVHEAPFGAPTQLWDIAIRAIVEALRQHPAAVVDDAAACRLDDYLSGEFGIRIGKQAARAALTAALSSVWGVESP